MRALYSEKTKDIGLILSEEKSKTLKRKMGCGPVLEAECEGVKFLLMNSINTFGYVEVIEPKDTRVFNVYTIKISDKAYEDLIKNKRIETQYEENSKIILAIEN